jgi:hypothetical protein
MEKIAFIGGYDKTDLILYIGKILTTLGKKVLMIDTTTMQKSRYIIPVMTPAQRYITTYQDIDIAVGLFRGFEDIKSYLGTQELEYDYILLDIDNAAFYQAYQVTPNDKHFFVTSFDLYNLKKGLNALLRIQTPINIIKVYFTKYMSPEEDEYLNYLSRGLNIRWNKDIVYFPFETADLDAIYVNQRKAGISLLGLSSSYIDSLLFLTEIISERSSGEVKKAAKVLMKE